MRFRRVTAPTHATLEGMVQRLSERVGRHLERHGLLVRDLEHRDLNLTDNEEDAAMDSLRGHSIIHRIAA